MRALLLVVSVGSVLSCRQDCEPRVAASYVEPQREVHWIHWAAPVGPRVVYAVYTGGFTYSLYSVHAMGLDEPVSLGVSVDWSNGAIELDGRLILFGSGGLISTDGTPGGTVWLAEAYPGGAGLHYSGSLVRIGDRGYYRGGSVVDMEPWTTDGTPEGTYRITDLNPDGSSWPSGFRALGDRVAFYADDRVGSYNPLNLESRPFVTDGTAAGTVELDEMPDGLPEPHEVDNRALDWEFGERDGPMQVSRVYDDGERATINLPGRDGWEGDGIWRFGGAIWISIEDRYNRSELWRVSERCLP